MPVIEPEDELHKKALFTACVTPSFAEMLGAECEILDSSAPHRVVEQLLRYALSRDNMFQAWREQPQWRRLPGLCLSALGEPLPLRSWRVPLPRRDGGRLD